MTSLKGVLLLACLISLSLLSAEEVQLQLSPVEKLIDYEFSMNFSQMIPGVEYTGFIVAKWAVPDAALSGLEGKTLTVKVTATTEDNSSSIIFPTAQDAGKKQATAYLSCDVAEGKCSPSSVLSAEIPFTALVKQGEESKPTITLESSLVQEKQEEKESASAEEKAAMQAEEFFQSLFSGNSTQNSSSDTSLSLSAELLNFSGNSSGNESFLDSLKPAGNPRDPVLYLRENPLISLTALAIVIIITGAYLLKSKD